MFKTKHHLGSPNALLNTPKIPHKALPDSPSSHISPRSFSRAEHRPPTLLNSSLSTRSLAPRTSTPKPPTPMPLKSILKGKSSPPRDSYESDGEIMTAKKVSRNDVPTSLPPNAHLGESLVQLVIYFRHYVPYLILRSMKVP
jgi:hypothetical protein